MKLIPLILASYSVAVLGCDNQVRTLDHGGLDDVTLARVSDYPCEIEFRPLNVSLEATLNDDTPVPGEVVARGLSGGYISSAFGGGKIHLWDASGRYTGTIGMPGTGPGELGPAAFPLHGADGVVHIIDPSNARWTRLTSKGELLSTVSSNVLTRPVGRGAYALVNDTVLLAGTPGSAGYFTLISASGGSTSNVVMRPSEHMTTERPVVIAHDGMSFWSSRTVDGTGGYILENWTFDGDLLKRVHRPRGPVPTPDPTSTGRGIQPLMFRAGDDQLLVQYFEALPHPETGAAGAVTFEIIDIVTADVLASHREVFDNFVGEGAPALYALLPDGELGMRYEESAGAFSIRLVEYSLQRRDTGDQASCGR